MFTSTKSATEACTVLVDHGMLPVTPAFAETRQQNQQQQQKHQNQTKRGPCRVKSKTTTIDKSIALRVNKSQ